MFKLTPAGVLTTLHQFLGPDGAGPDTSLIQGGDQALYGMTGGGGNGQGTVFKITTSGVLTTLYRFSGLDGSAPEAALVQGPDGNFYGTTVRGGSNNQGIVFKMTPSGLLTVLHEFSTVDGSPQAPLMIALDGNLYGISASITVSHHGKIFKITPSGAFSIVHSFSGSDGTFSDGPYGALVQGADGKLYGSTNEGGTYNQGTIFSLTLGDASPTLLSVHPVPAAALPAASTDNVDATLSVRASDILLKTNQPSLTGGLVADGVTPLLIELDTNPAPSQATTFTFGVTVTGGQLVTGALDQYPVCSSAIGKQRAVCSRK